MYLTKQLRLEIEEIENGDLHNRAELLSNWLQKDKKKTFDEIQYLLTLHIELNANLTRELANLRNEDREPEKKFFPMSTTARKSRL